MPKQVFLDPRLDKHMDRLRRSGRKAAMAALRAAEIISRLRGGEAVVHRVGAVTKHGELRIKGVMKYDLGGGYRLVAYRHGAYFYLLFIGSHDDCNRWIENNRELTPEQIEARCTPLRRCGPVADPAGEGQTLDVEPLERDPLASVDEGILRRIFCGLAGERRSGPQ
jgi:hypothetical protein